MKNRINLRVVSLVTLATALAASQASAQVIIAPGSDEVVGAQDEAQVDAPRAAAGGNEIIVTAQKREERLQDVPLAVTAVTGEALAARNITDTSDLTRVAPSLSFQQGNNPSNASFRLRGVGTALFGQGSESAVSVVLDGVVLARQAQGFADLADIERIEVLRGPQGTLFGKNATAGVIHVITERPTDYLSGRVQGTIAEYDEYRVSGTISGPVAEGVGMRLTGFYNNDDGYIYNYTQEENVNGYESWGVRGKLEFEPTDRLNILAAAEYRNNDSDCCQQILVRSDNPNLTELFSPIEPRPFYREAVANEGVTSETSQQTYSVQADYDLDFATVTSITAYQNYEFSNNFDFDAIDTTVPVFTGPSFAAFDRNGGEFGLGQFSQELRLSSNGNRSLDYVFGLFYSNTNIDRNFERRLAQCPGGNPANRGLAIGDPCPAPLFLSGSLQNAHFDGESYAAFGQLDYDILDNLTVIGGLRVQREIIAVEGVQTGKPMVQGDIPLFRPVTGRVSTSDTALSGKLGLQYRFSTDAQAYATYTHGYKGPGLDTEVNTDFLNQDPLEPETVDAYELGFKGNLADGLVSLAIAAFYADYENLQILANRSDPETGNFSFLPTNAGRSVTKGVEVEANFWLSDAFSVLTAVNYVDAEIDADGLGCPLQFQAASVTVPVGGEQPINTCFRQALSGGGLSGVLQNVRGARLPSTPEWRVLISPKYEHEFGDSIGFVNLDLSYQSDMTFAEGDPLADQDGYALVDASIGFRPVGTGLSARVFVRNAFDQHYYTNFGAAALLTTATLTPTNRMGFVPKGAFRHFGATIGYTF